MSLVIDASTRIVMSRSLHFNAQGGKPIDFAVQRLLIVDSATGKPVARCEPIAAAPAEPEPTRDTSVLRDAYASWAERNLLNAAPWSLRSEAEPAPPPGIVETIDKLGKIATGATIREPVLLDRLVSPSAPLQVLPEGITVIPHPSLVPEYVPTVAPKDLPEMVMVVDRLAERISEMPPEVRAEIEEYVHRPRFPGAEDLPDEPGPPLPPPEVPYEHLCLEPLAAPSEPIVVEPPIDSGDQTPRRRHHGPPPPVESDDDYMRLAEPFGRPGEPVRVPGPDSGPPDYLVRYEYPSSGTPVVVEPPAAPAPVVPPKPAAKPKAPTAKPRNRPKSVVPGMTTEQFLAARAKLQAEKAQAASKPMVVTVPVVERTLPSGRDANGVPANVRLLTDSQREWLQRLWQQDPAAHPDTIASRFAAQFRFTPSLTAVEANKPVSPTKPAQPVLSPCVEG